MKDILTELDAINIQDKDIYQIINMIKNQYPKLYSKLKILYEANNNQRMIIDPILFKTKKKPNILIFTPSFSNNKIKSIAHFNTNNYQFILSRFSHELLEIYATLKANNYSLPYYPFKSGILCVLYNMGYNGISENVCLK